MLRWFGGALDDPGPTSQNGPTVKLTRTALVAAAVVGLTITALPAGAAEMGTGRDFAVHVVMHNDHFSGEMNPGMHEGYAGWPDHHHPM